MFKWDDGSKFDARGWGLGARIFACFPLPPSTLFFAFSLFPFAFSLVACQVNGETWTRVEQSGVLRVGLDPTYPPFENGDRGQLVGLDVDLARALGEQLGVEIEFVYFGYDGLYDALGTGQVDVLLSALVVDVGKTKDFAYGEPYFNAGQFLVVRSDTADTGSLSEMEDLTGRTAAVEIGSEGHVQLIEWQRRVPDLEVMTLPSADDALWVVLQGEADVAVVDQVSGRLYRQNFPDLVLVGDPVTVEPYAAVTRIGDAILLKKLDEALASLGESGELALIQARWLD